MYWESDSSSREEFNKTAAFKARLMTKTAQQKEKISRRCSFTLAHGVLLFKHTRRWTLPNTNVLQSHRRKLALSITNVPPVVSCILFPSTLCNNTTFLAQSHLKTCWSSMLCRTNAVMLLQSTEDLSEKPFLYRKRMQPQGGRTNGYKHSCTKSVPHRFRRGGCENPILWSPPRANSWVLRYLARANFSDLIVCADPVVWVISYRPH